MIREIIQEMDGGNRGEYNQARKEQEEEKERKDKLAVAHKDFLEVAKILVPRISNATGKRWGFENSAMYATYGMDPHSIFKNPGRLKNYKIRKGNNVDEEELGALFFVISNGVSEFKNIKVDTMWGNLEFSHKGKTFVITNWGKKVDLKIQYKI